MVYLPEWGTGKEVQVLVESMYLQTDKNPFLLCFAFPKEGRGNVSVTAYTVWLFEVGRFFFVNYVILKDVGLRNDNNNKS